MPTLFAWHQTLPSAQTQAAKNAMQAFFCQLCSKGYSRVNEYEAHLSSYDHSHKQRLKDMKAMVKDSNAVARARRAEAKADGIVAVQIADSSELAGDQSVASSSGGFKKGGFKKTVVATAVKPRAAFMRSDSCVAESNSNSNSNGLLGDCANTSANNDGETVVDSSDDEVYERYNPRNPTL
ncbi:uncharacterized protein BROUX77_000048 [Berkeleyomyces rouxiae]|uniref:uncharacterized protein n=1 Tax=Berkeleyomyces rouxiae TaxID=2035830 RepID=UPI003B81D37F